MKGFWGLAVQRKTPMYYLSTYQRKHRKALWGGENSYLAPIFRIIVSFRVVEVRVRVRF